MHFDCFSLRSQYHRALENKGEQEKYFNFITNQMWKIIKRKRFLVAKAPCWRTNFVNLTLLPVLYIFTPLITDDKTKTFLEFTYAQIQTLEFWIWFTKISIRPTINSKSLVVCCKSIECTILLVTLQNPGQCLVYFVYWSSHGRLSQYTGPRGGHSLYLFVGFLSSDFFLLRRITNFQFILFKNITVQVEGW